TPPPTRSSSARVRRPHASGRSSCRCAWPTWPPRSRRSRPRPPRRRKARSAATRPPPRLLPAEPLAQLLGCDPERGEDLAADALRVGGDRQQDVVGAELLAPGRLRFDERALERALRARRERTGKPGDPRLLARD